MINRTLTCYGVTYTLIRYKKYITKEAIRLQIMVYERKGFYGNPSLTRRYYYEAFRPVSNFYSYAVSCKGESNTRSGMFKDLKKDLLDSNPQYREVMRKLDTNKDEFSNSYYSTGFLPSIAFEGLKKVAQLLKQHK